MQFIWQQYPLLLLLCACIVSPWLKHDVILALSDCCGMLTRDPHLHVNTNISVYTLYMYHALNTCVHALYGTLYMCSHAPRDRVKVNHSLVMCVLFKTHCSWPGVFFWLPYSWSCFCMKWYGWLNLHMFTHILYTHTCTNAHTPAQMHTSYACTSSCSAHGVLWVLQTVRVFQVYWIPSCDGRGELGVMEGVWLRVWLMEVYWVKVPQVRDGIVANNRSVVLVAAIGLWNLGSSECSGLLRVILIAQDVKDY